MDTSNPSVLAVVRGINEPARLALGAILGESLNVINNLEIFCPLKTAPCKREIGFGQITELFWALQGDKARDADSPRTGSTPGH